MASTTLSFVFGAFYVVFSIFLLTTDAKPLKYFNVFDYGAVADGKTDNAKAFLKAWDHACNYHGKSRVLIPNGVFKIGSVTFSGPCKAKQMAFILKGTLKAPKDKSEFITEKWIEFIYLNRLLVKGGGYLDGEGKSAWHLNDCAHNPSCPSLPASMTLNFVNNSRISHIRSINSKNAHVIIFASRNIKITQVRLTAPAESPNTDGIKIGASSDIKISKSNIQTGDDCVAIVAGSENIRVSEVTCGPGHGISIGSIGKTAGDRISGVHVVNCTFVGTDNGARIKTWSPSASSFVSDVFFGYIYMKDVRNPIFIDQNYCPSLASHCSQGPWNSRVEIKDVTFRNIWGTSTSKIALALNCSSVVPCKNINLVDINLNYYNRDGGPSESSCANVIGKVQGRLLPPGCL